MTNWIHLAQNAVIRVMMVSGDLGVDKKRTLIWALHEVVN